MVENEPLRIEREVSLRWGGAPSPIVALCGPFEVSGIANRATAAVNFFQLDAVSSMLGPVVLRPAGAREKSGIDLPICYLSSLRPSGR